MWRPALCTGFLVALAGEVAAKELEVVVDRPALALPAAERKRLTDQAFTATAVAIPAGPLTLAEAVAALAAGGNPTRLAPGVEGGQRAETAGFQGTYWQAVAWVGERFSLAPLPGMVHLPLVRSDTSDKDAVQIRVGPVELAPADAGAPQRLIPCGAALVSVREAILHQPRTLIGSAGPLKPWIQGRFSLRLEPRTDLGRLGTCRVTWNAITETKGAGLRIVGRSSDPASGTNALRLEALDAPLPHSPNATPAGADVAGDLLVSLIEPWSADVPLAVGDQARIVLGPPAGPPTGQAPASEATPGDNRLLLKLADQDAKLALSLTWPKAALAGDPVLILLRDGAALANRGMSRGQEAGKGQRSLTRVFTAAQDGAHVARVKGFVAFASVSLPLHFPLDLAAAPVLATRLPLEPARVRWAAGAATLAESVGRLCADGQSVLLSFGIDDQRRATLAAFDGTWWEAVLTLCRAYDLVVLPANPPAGEAMGKVVSGPVHLAAAPAHLAAAGADRPGTAPVFACGPLLVEVTQTAIELRRGPDGGGRSLLVGCVLRVEPRIDPERLGGVALSWASATLPDGGNLPIFGNGPTTPIPFSRQNRLPRVIVQTDEDGDGHPDQALTRVDRLPPGRQSLRLNGQATVALRQQARVELRLSAGSWATRDLAGLPVSAALLTAAQAEDLGLPSSPCLLFSPSVNQNPVRHSLSAPGGATVRLESSNSVYLNGRYLRSFPLPELLPGDYTLALNLAGPASEVHLPLALQIEAPE